MLPTRGKNELARWSCTLLLSGGEVLERVEGVPRVRLGVDNEDVLRELDPLPHHFLLLLGRLLELFAAQQEQVVVRQVRIVVQPHVLLLAVDRGHDPRHHVDVGLEADRVHVAAIQMAVAHENHLPDGAGLLVVGDPVRADHRHVGEVDEVVGVAAEEQRLQEGDGGGAGADHDDLLVDLDLGHAGEAHGRQVEAEGLVVLEEGLRHLVLLHDLAAVLRNGVGQHRDHVHQDVDYGEGPVGVHVVVPLQPVVEGVEAAQPVDLPREKRHVTLENRRDQELLDAPLGAKLRLSGVDPGVEVVVELQVLVLFLLGHD
jgi:hypothetical protein